jgi:hypothetical protein
LHSYKYAAELQYLVGNNVDQIDPLLLRVEVNTGFLFFSNLKGHGGGKPLSRIIKENSDILSFISLSLNLSWNWKI